jgi:hypothetical protein
MDLLASGHTIGQRERAGPRPLKDRLAAADTRLSVARFASRASLRT